MADWRGDLDLLHAEAFDHVGGIVTRDREAERGEVARVQPVVTERRVEDERQRRVEEARPGRADVLLGRRPRESGTESCAAARRQDRVGRGRDAGGAAAGGLPTGVLPSVGRRRRRGAPAAGTRRSDGRRRVSGGRGTSGGSCCSHR